MSELSIFFKSIENTSVIPALNYILKHGCTPNFIITNEGKSFMKFLRNCSEIIFNMVDHSKNKGDNIVYVSHNPMDFLTIGHDGYLDSCQCLTKNNKINISTKNSNIIQSYNLDILNDFVMYTGNLRSINNKFKKTSRITMH